MCEFRQLTLTNPIYLYRRLLGQILDRQIKATIAYEYVPSNIIGGSLYDQLPNKTISIQYSLIYLYDQNYEPNSFIYIVITSL